MKDVFVLTDVSLVVVVSLMSHAHPPCEINTECSERTCLRCVDSGTTTSWPHPGCTRADVTDGHVLTSVLSKLREYFYFQQMNVKPSRDSSSAFLSGRGREQQQKKT